MQTTKVKGLQDKNGKDVYEGDKTKMGYIIKYCKEKALFAEYGSRDGGINFDIIMSYPISLHNLQIVGDIYDDTNLLQ